MNKILFTSSLILLAVLTRLLPHPVNFAPVTAIALFGAVNFDKKSAFLIPMIAMLVSDYFIGFYSGMVWVYSSFLAIGCIGLWLRNHQGVLTTVGATLAGSILFFVVTNFGVWITSHATYPLTYEGFIACYVAAIPFFRNSLAGDFVYVAALFGSYELFRRFIPSLGSAPAQSNS